MGETFLGDPEIAKWWDRLMEADGSSRLSMVREKLSEEIDTEWNPLCFPRPSMSRKRIRMRVGFWRKRIKLHSLTVTTNDAGCALGPSKQAGGRHVLAGGTAVFVNLSVAAF